MRLGETGDLIARVVLLALLAAPAFAQDPAPAQDPTTPADPLAAEMFVGAYAWREVVHSTAAGRSDGWGGRFVGQLGFGRFGIAARGDVGGLPGEFSPEAPQTFQSASFYLAAHYNVLAQAPARLGLTAFAGRAVSLEGDGIVTPTVGNFTAGVGVRVAAPGAVAYIALGTHEALGGFCVLGTAHLPLTSRLAFVVDGAASGDGRAYVRLGIAVALAIGGNP